MSTPKTYSRYYGAAIRIVIAAQDKGLDGALRPLAGTNKTVWPKLMTDSNGVISYAAIEGAVARPLTSAEITAMTYTGDKALARFFELLIPGGTKPDNFAMIPLAKVLVFSGTDESDAEPAMLPFFVKRISEGDESLV